MKTTCKGSRIVIFQMLIVLIMSSVALAGNTYYVSTNGSDSGSGTQDSPWRTIQNAAGEVSAGDTIIVSAGTYNERVTTEVGGASSNRITFKADGTVVMRGFRLNHDYVTVDGFDITNTPTGGAGDSCGVYAGSGSDSCEILNCNIHDTAKVLHAEGIFMSTSSPYASNYLIQGNTIYRTYNTGIMALGDGHSIINNEVYDVRWPGGGDTDACRFFGDNQTWRGNYIHDVSTYAYGHTDAWQSWCGSGKPSTSNLVIEDNIVDTVCPMAGGGDGMSIIAFNGDFCALGSNMNWTIRNNVFRPNCSVLPGSHTGFIYNVNGLYIYNNTFVDGGNQTSMRIASMNRNVHVKNNIYYKTPHTIQERQYAEISNNYCTTLTGTLCENSKFQAGDGINSTNPPGFVSYATQDFHLQAGSPVIDAGASIATVSTDKDGVSRPQGSGFDIGAYEFSSSLSAPENLRIIE